jgi:hypothetical protein
LTLTVPAPRSQVFIATTTFDMVNDGGQPGYSASGLGYMDLDGVNLATFASFRGGLGTGASAACTWIGVLQPGNHSFQMFVNSDTWAAIHIFSATLTVAVVS